MSSRKIVAATAAILLFLPAVAQARKSTWSGEDGFVSATVDTRQNTITIYFNVDGDKLLYWTGSYNPNQIVFVSKANRDAMKYAIFASEDKHKVFVRKNNRLRFSMSFMGKTKRVMLVRK